METGLTEPQRKAPGVNQNKADAIYDSSHSPLQSPTAIHYQNAYSVSEYRHSGRSSDET